jgi:hypothetical protein
VPPKVPARKSHSQHEGQLDTNPRASKETSSVQKRIGFETSLCWLVILPNSLKSHLIYQLQSQLRKKPDKFPKLASELASELASKVASQKASFLKL